LRYNKNYIPLADFTGKVLQKQIIDSWKEYLSHNVETWRRDYFDRDNGGYLVTARRRIERSTVSKQERAKLRKELDMAMVYAKNGYRIEMLEEKPGISSPDVMINGMKGDLKRLSSHNNIVKEAKNAIRKQKSELVLFQFDEMNHVIQQELYKLRLQNIRGFYFVTGANTVYPF
jgi:hypothetical protein